MSDKQIARATGLRKHTVHDYIKRIHREFGVESRGELLVKCLRCDSSPVFRWLQEPERIPPPSRGRPRKLIEPVRDALPLAEIEPYGLR